MSFVGAGDAKMSCQEVVRIGVTLAELQVRQEGAEVF
jgi:hypothetical protein